MYVLLTTPQENPSREHPLIFFHLNLSSTWRHISVVSGVDWGTIRDLDSTEKFLQDGIRSLVPILTLEFVPTKNRFPLKISHGVDSGREGVDSFTYWILTSLRPVV